MSVVSDLLVRFSNWVTNNGYLLELSLAQIATVLVVYGGEMARYFRDLLKKNPFFIRITGFILLNAFGIGIATVFGGRIMTKFYMQIGPVIRMPVIFAVFLVIGIVAERKRHI